ncbi:iron ABC transporter substrate-binding protein [Brachybacterium endophyticum]|uniref:Iron ABC transporter substrate-binding protein n=1 Tax=Brachybacterium endophyticum TaxID=2182385 RepID=A0A2U2RN53_9MICO|nr:iron-siderophore ABC transporter substrate-binding protein [Brachybacterium endophyticum]PWH07303.1 iron ABC transporter substrate-binding protein [Brachybacterium endophyticum]
MTRHPLAPSGPDDSRAARPGRRTLLAGAVAAPLGLALAACTGSTSADEKSSDDKDSSGAFPVTIKHALGSAVIEKKPTRIVTLGQGSTETCVALGTIPVGVEDYAWGADDSGQLPWVREAIEKKNGKLPKLIKGSTELDTEAILALAPDLILAPWSGVTKEQYEVLKDIAPTVAYEKEAWVITWKQQISTICTALGVPSKADELIQGIEDEFTDRKQAEWEDLTFSFIYNSGKGTLGVFYPDEQRVAMVSALGLKVDPIKDEISKYEVEGTDSASIGLENADMLDHSDLIFTFYSDQANRKEVESQPLYAKIPAAEAGALVAPTDQSFVTGSSMINPLTVPWALERYVPMIEKAVTKVQK